MNLLKLIVINIFVLTFIFAAAGCSADSNSYKPVVRGVADLSDGRLNNAVIELNGEWEFYPGRFILPDEFDKLNADKKYLDVPGAWNSLQPAKGYGTYRIRVIFPQNYTNYSLKLMWVKSSAKLWIDEALLLIRGRPQIQKLPLYPAII
jgi:hypothetical protein